MNKASTKSETDRELREEVPKLLDHTAKEFRKLFDDSGLSQEEFARAIGLSQPTLSALLSGKRALRGPKLKLVARFFNVNEAWLLGDADAGGPRRDGEEAMHPPLDPRPGTIGERLVQLGERLHLSRAKLAATIDVSPSLLSGWIGGRRPMKARYVNALVARHNVRREWLDGAGGEMFNPAVVSAPAGTGPGNKDALTMLVQQVGELSRDLAEARKRQLPVSLGELTALEIELLSRLRRFSEAQREAVLAKIREVEALVGKPSKRVAS